MKKAALAALLWLGSASAQAYWPDDAISQSFDPPPNLELAEQLDLDGAASRQALEIASRLTGLRYQRGANGPDAVDCSALVQQAYGGAGVELPRDTRSMLRAVEPVERGAMRAGDLLFFRTGPRQLHVGIYDGAGRFVHASPKHRRVIVVDFNARWRKLLLKIGRVVMADVRR